jgi:hypothetical protein
MGSHQGCLRPELVVALMLLLRALPRGNGWSAVTASAGAGAPAAAAARLAGWNRAASVQRHVLHLLLLLLLLLDKLLSLLCRLCACGMRDG